MVLNEGDIIKIAERKIEFDEKDLESTGLAIRKLIDKKKEEINRRKK